VLECRRGRRGAGRHFRFGKGRKEEVGEVKGKVAKTVEKGCNLRDGMDKNIGEIQKG